MTAPNHSAFVDDFLEHFGTKGMKWGVRNDKGHEGERAKTKKIAKLDKNFDKNASSVKTFIQIHNKAADMSNKNDIDRINNKPEYANADFSRDSPLRQKYYKEHQDAYLDNAARAASEMGTNASGTRSLGIREDQDGNWSVQLMELRQAASDDSGVLYTVEVKYKNGRITELDTSASISQGDADENSLAHFGTKGMKWGVRKSATERRVERAAPSEVKVKSNPSVLGSQDIKVKAAPGRGVVRTRGGARNVATSDAIEAKAGRQKARASTTDALSNAELKKVVDRMKLEQQFNKLRKEEPALKRGKEKVQDILAKHGPDLIDAVLKRAS